MKPKEVSMSITSERTAELVKEFGKSENDRFSCGAGCDSDRAYR